MSQIETNDSIGLQFKKKKNRNHDGNQILKTLNTFHLQSDKIHA